MGEGQGCSTGEAKRLTSSSAKLEESGPQTNRYDHDTFESVPRSKPDPALSATVRALREERGHTREAMAYEAGITTGTLAHIELALCSPSWDSFRRIATALDLSISRLAAAVEIAEEIDAERAA